MFGDNNSSIDNETIELLENAQSGIRQKKNVYRHFIFYLFISGFFLFVDLVLAVGENLSIFKVFKIKKKITKLKVTIYKK